MSWPQYVRVLNADLKRKEAYVADIEKILRETEDVRKKKLFSQLLEYRRGQAELAKAMIKKAMKSWNPNNANSA